MQYLLITVINILQKNGQPISWKFIEDLYLKSTQSGGLSTQHKLKYEHIHLTSYSKMNLAAQVSTNISHLY